MPIVLVPKPAPPTPGPARTGRYWLMTGLLSLLLLAAVGAVWWFTSTGGTARYVTTVVTRGDVIRIVTATGTVNPVLTIIVGSYVSGVIRDVQCDYNTRVKKRQVCAKIDPRPHQAQVDQSKANLAVARAQLEKDRAAFEYAKLTFDRNARLVQTNAVSKDAYDNAETAYDQALAQITFDEATIQQREAALTSAQVNLDYTDIVSPVDGTVVSRNVTIGQTVTASFQTPTLFLIATDLTKMQVDTNVSESDIGGVKEGDRAFFTVDAFSNRTFQGTVTQVRQSPQSVQNVVTYDVVVSVDNRDLTLKPGMTAANRIVIAERKDVLRVPSQALRYAPAGLAVARSERRTAGRPGSGGSREGRVFVLRDGQPTPVSVVTGLDADATTEIVKGDLQLGEQVIIAEQRGGAGNSSTARTPHLRL